MDKTTIEYVLCAIATALGIIGLCVACYCPLTSLGILTEENEQSLGLAFAIIGIILLFIILIIGIFTENVEENFRNGRYG